MASTAPKTANSENVRKSNMDLSPAEKKATMKAMIMKAVDSLPPLSPFLEQFEIEIPTQDGWKSRTVIVRPKSPRPGASLIVNFFGGGFIVGEPEMTLNSARQFAEEYGAIVALPSYRLAPEVRWPVPMKDGWDVVVWLSQHAEEELGADLDAGFIIGGLSAGATVAGVCGGLAMHPDLPEAREAPKLAKPITGLFFCAGGFLVEEIVPPQLRASWTSRKDNLDHPSLPGPAIEAVLSWLQVTDYKSLWWSAINGIVQDKPQSNVRVYFQYGQFDGFRDDTVVYEKLLADQGVETKAHLLAKDGHVGWTVMSPKTVSTNPNIEEASMDGMKWLLKM